MAEADTKIVVVESKAPPEVQARAEKMGWIPPTRFKGDVEKFVDADTYIERGETVMPIIKEQNKRLAAEVSALRTAADLNTAALKAAQDAIAEIEERHTVATQKAVEKARIDLKTSLAAASEAGDHEAVAELTDQMTQLNKAEVKAEKKEVIADTPKPFVPPPELAEWNAENEWFGKDDEKTALALGIAQRLRKAGDTTVGRPFFDRVAAEMKKKYREDGDETVHTDKVEGANHSGGESETRQSGKKTFNHLPADAKAACKADSKRFVGPGKRYKTEAEWNTRYAEIYFQE